VVAGFQGLGFYRPGPVFSGGVLSLVFGGYFFQGFSEVFNVFAPEGGSVETV